MQFLRDQLVWIRWCSRKRNELMPSTEPCHFNWEGFLENGSELIAAKLRDVKQAGT